MIAVVGGVAIVIVGGAVYFLSGGLLWRESLSLVAAGTTFAIVGGTTGDLWRAAKAGLIVGAATELTLWSIKGASALRALTTKEFARQGLARYVFGAGLRVGTSAGEGYVGGPAFGTAGDPNIDYIEVQIGRTEDQYLTALSLRKYGKPVWFEEYWYEPASCDKPPEEQVPRGMRNTHRNFVAALAFPTMGSLMRAHAGFEDFPPALSARTGKTLQEILSQDRGANAMSRFAASYRDLDLRGFSPQPNRTSAGVCGRFGKDYAVFVAGGGDFTLDLSDGEGVFSVRSLDIHTGTVSDLGKTSGGRMARIGVPAGQDTALLFRKAP